MAKPFVSVLIDTYNHERFIEQAVQSVLEQDFPASDREILVVDDGSTDRTREILKKFEPQIRVLRKKNGGQASAFNVGIPECRGEIVSLLDGDDWWKKAKLSAVARAFLEEPEVGTVGHGMHVVGSNGEAAAITPDKTYRLATQSVESARLFAQLRAFFGTSRVSYRKSVLDSLLLIPEEAVIEADEFLMTAALCVADMKILQQPLFYYRLHSSNQFMLTTSDEKSHRRKYQALACLKRELPAKMRALGAAEPVVDAALRPLYLEVEVLRLQLNGGSRWDVWKAERLNYELEYNRKPLAFRAFKQIVFLATLVLPPKLFFRLKRWYTKSVFREWRRRIGEPSWAAPIIGRMPDKQSEYIRATDE